MKSFHFVALTILAGVCILQSEVHGQKLAGVFCNISSTDPLNPSLAKCTAGTPTCATDFRLGTRGQLTCSDKSAKISITGCPANSSASFSCITGIERFSCSQGGKAVNTTTKTILICGKPPNLDFQPVCTSRGGTFKTAVGCPNNSQPKFLSSTLQRVPNPCQNSVAPFCDIP